MQNKTFKLLGLAATFSVPTTSAEYNQISGRSGDPACEDAVENSVYRGCGADWRAALIEAVEKETGIARKVVRQGPPRKDGTRPDVFESEGDYFKRVCAESGRSPETFQGLADTFNVGGSNEIKFDNTETKSAGVTKAKTARKEYRSLVDAAITQHGIDRVRKNVSRLSGKELAADADAGVIALALQAHRDAEEAAKTQAAAGALGA